MCETMRRLWRSGWTAILTAITTGTRRATNGKAGWRAAIRSTPYDTDTMLAGTVRRDTSEDAYDEDYHMQHRMKRFCINLLMWHFWFVIDCIALWHARGGVR